MKELTRQELQASQRLTANKSIVAGVLAAYSKKAKVAGVTAAYSKQGESIKSDAGVD